MPGTIPATSQLDRLISMTAIKVLAGSRAMRDRLKSFNVCMDSSIGSQRTMDAISTPRPHSIFYGFNRPGAKPLDGVIENWWRQGMMGGAKAHYDGIKAFSETDLTEDLKAIDAPTLVMQGDDDQIVPYKGAALLQVKLLKNATLKLYPGYPHGMLTTYSETINKDLLE